LTQQNETQRATAKVSRAHWTAIAGLGFGFAGFLIDMVSEPMILGSYLLTIGWCIAVLALSRIAWKQRSRLLAPAGVLVLLGLAIFAMFQPSWNARIVSGLMWRKFPTITSSTAERRGPEDVCSVDAEGAPARLPVARASSRPASQMEVHSLYNPGTATVFAFHLVSNSAARLEAITVRVSRLSPLPKLDDCIRVSPVEEAPVIVVDISAAALGEAPVDVDIPAAGMTRDGAPAALLLEEKKAEYVAVRVTSATEGVYVLSHLTLWFTSGRVRVPVHVSLGEVEIAFQ